MKRNNMILCGFMGCGKSTVGRLLAEKTGMNFVDMDAFIEEQSGMRVAALFEQYGEDGFRAQEHRACLALAQRSNTVTAAGGGALTFPRNAEALRKTGRIFLLDVPGEVLLSRLAADPAVRPVIRDKVPEEILALLDSRLPAYRAAADCIIDANCSPAQAVAEILRKKEDWEMMI